MPPKIKQSQQNSGFQYDSTLDNKVGRRTGAHLGKSSIQKDPDGIERFTDYFSEKSENKPITTTAYNSLDEDYDDLDGGAYLQSEKSRAEVESNRRRSARHILPSSLYPLGGAAISRTQTTPTTAKKTITAQGVKDATQYENQEAVSFSARGAAKRRNIPPQSPASQQGKFQGLIRGISSASSVKFMSSIKKENQQSLMIEQSADKSLLQQLQGHNFLNSELEEIVDGELDLEISESVDEPQDEKVGGQKRKGKSAQDKTSQEDLENLINQNELLFRTLEKTRDADSQPHEQMTEASQSNGSGIKQKLSREIILEKVNQLRMDIDPSFVAAKKTPKDVLKQNETIFQRKNDSNLNSSAAFAKEDLDFDSIHALSVTKTVLETEKSIERSKESPKTKIEPQNTPPQTETAMPIELNQEMQTEIVKTALRYEPSSSDVEQAIAQLEASSAAPKNQQQQQQLPNSAQLLQPEKQEQQQQQPPSEYETPPLRQQKRRGRPAKQQRSNSTQNQKQKRSLNKSTAEERSNKNDVSSSSASTNKPKKKLKTQKKMLKDRKIYLQYCQNMLLEDKVHGEKEFIMSEHDQTYGNGRYPNRTRLKPIRPWLGEKPIVENGKIVGVKASAIYDPSIDYKIRPYKPPKKLLPRSKSLNSSTESNESNKKSNNSGKKSKKQNNKDQEEEEEEYEQNKNQKIVVVSNYPATMIEEQEEQEQEEEDEEAKTVEIIENCLGLSTKKLNLLIITQRGRTIKFNLSIPRSWKHGVCRLTDCEELVSNCESYKFDVSIDSAPPRHCIAKDELSISCGEKYSFENFSTLKVAELSLTLIK